MCIANGILFSCSLLLFTPMILSSFFPQILTFHVNSSFFLIILQLIMLNLILFLFHPPGTFPMRAYGHNWTKVDLMVTCNKYYIDFQSVALPNLTNEIEPKNSNNKVFAHAYNLDMVAIVVKITITAITGKIAQTRLGSLYRAPMSTHVQTANECNLVKTSL